MARYPADHKEQTRARLVSVARKLFRERGFDAVSIDVLMKAAGLTRGGFYAHFASKEALVQEVLRVDSGLLAALRATSDVDEAATHLSAYLDPALREQLTYCPLVAHPMDARRGGDERQALYEAQVSGLSERLEALLGGGADAQREAFVLTALALGAAVIASSAASDELASGVAEACRSELTRRLEPK